MLQKQQEEILRILEKIDVKEYENTELLRICRIPERRTSSRLYKLTEVALRMNFSKRSWIAKKSWRRITLK